MSKHFRRQAVACALVAIVLAAGCSSSGSKDDAKSTTTTAPAASGKRTLGADPGQLSAGDPSTAGYTPKGQLIADNGFRPETDGFGFENYGKSAPPTPERLNMGPNEMRKLFGDAVCADLKSSKCDLTPPAQQWMDEANKEIGRA